MPKVSVIVPIYNKEKYLRRCVTSILNQSIEDIEIILINDGSIDSSLEICNEFKQLDSRVIVLNQKNSGVSAARNAGMTLARGQFIGFVDADDYVEKDMYRSMYDKCIETNSRACLSNYMIVDETNIHPVGTDFSSDVLFKKEIIHEIILNMIAPESINQESTAIMGSSCRFLVEKDLIIENEIFFPDKIPLMEDLIFVFKLLSNLDKLCIDKNYNYYYCTNSDSALHIYRPDFFELSLHVSNILESILEEQDLYQIASHRFSNRYYSLAISSIVNELHPDNKKTKVEKLNNIKSICQNEEIQKNLQLIESSKISKSKRVTFNAIKNRKFNFLYYYYKLAIKITNTY